MSMGFGPLMTVDRMGDGGAESDMTVNPSLLCKGELSGDSDCWMGWVTGGPIEILVLPSVTLAAAMSSKVIERAWPLIDIGCDNVVT
jgi:hypothetical protein